MQKWEDIYNLSCEVLKKLCHEKESDGQILEKTDNSLVERVVDRLIGPNYLEDKQKEQERFNPHLAYRKLKSQACRRLIFRIGSVAAMFAVILGSAVLFYDIQNSEKNKPSIKEEILPGSRQAVLCLADGRNINLSNTLISLIETQDGTIKIDSLGVSCDTADKHLTQEPVNWNTLSIPRGGEYKLTLADGTTVWINSESEVRFPTRFQGDKRMVYLKGEAYFDVRSDSVHPFVVNTELGSVQVLGTQFNINAYNPDFISATLVEGKIAYLQGTVCKNVELDPGEQLTYRRGEGYHRICKVNTKLYTSWKDNIFCFEEQRLEEIMETLSRWYDINVFFESSDLKELEFSGLLNKYSSVGPLLHLFEMGSQVKFRINGKTVFIGSDR